MVLQPAHQRLRAVQKSIGRLAEFEMLELLLNEPPAEERAITLPWPCIVSEKSYRNLVRHEIADTVEHPAEVGEETNHLLKVLSAWRGFTSSRSFRNLPAPLRDRGSRSTLECFHLAGSLRRSLPPNA